jgi:hypothetical protein
MGGHVVLGVVKEDENVGALEERFTTNVNSCRESCRNRLFTRPYRRSALGGVVVRLQIDGDHDAPANCPVPEGSSYEDSGALDGPECPVGEVAGHRRVDPGEARLHVAVPQVYLGNDQVEGRGAIADEVRDIIPVAPVGGVLVTGDYRPSFHVDGRCGQKNIGEGKTDCGGR